jgi:hypothetical protein
MWFYHILSIGNVYTVLTYKEDLCIDKNINLLTV